MSLATLAHVEPVRNPLLGPELASRLVSLIRVVLTTQTGHSRAAQQLEKYSSLDLPCVFTQIPPRRVCCALIRRASPAISRTALLQIPTLDHYCTLDPDQPTNSCNSVWGLIPTQILRGEVIAAPTAPPPSFAALHPAASTPPAPIIAPSLPSLSPPALLIPTTPVLTPRARPATASASASSPSAKFSVSVVLAVADPPLVQVIVESDIPVLLQHLAYVVRCCIVALQPSLPASLAGTRHELNSSKLSPGSTNAGNKIQ